MPEEGGRAAHSEVKHAVQSHEEGGLARAGAPNNADLFPMPDREIHSIKGRACRWTVPHDDVFKNDAAIHRPMLKYLALCPGLFSTFHIDLLEVLPLDVRCIIMCIAHSFSLHSPHKVGTFHQAMVHRNKTQGHVCMQCAMEHSSSMTHHVCNHDFSWVSHRAPQHQQGMVCMCTGVCTY
jgi:hypothetical protein